MHIAAWESYNTSKASGINLIAVVGTEKSNWRPIRVLDSKRQGQLVTKTVPLKQG